MARRLNKHTRMWWREIEFEVQELLGEGGQGRVFKALRRDRASGLCQHVALKILHSKTAVELWKKEFASLARVRSPYCVQVLSFERVQGRPALVLELIEGVTLSELGLLPEALIEEILAQIERGLTDLRDQGVFHGDLSPHNVMIGRDGGVRLLDFGLANATLRLTPAFAAPERMNGAPASFAADLYSLGRIEEFLRGRRLNTPWLSFEPAKRTPRGVRSQGPHRQMLAGAAAAILQRRQHNAGLATRTQVTGTTPRRRAWKLNNAALLALITGFFSLAVSGAAQNRREETAALSIRTHIWHYFVLDGVPAGYAPLNLNLQAGRRYRLEWTSPSGRGQREILFPRAGQAVWTDRDFSH